MIPQHIHQIWIGPKPVPKCVASWKKNHPDYAYTLWDNDRVQTLFPLRTQHLYDAYDRETSNVWNGRSNLLRLEILERFGGLYIDADTESLRPLDPAFFTYPAFIVYVNEQMRPGRLNNAIMGAPAGHPLLKTIIDQLAAEPEIKQPSHIFSGPTRVTNVINDTDAAIVKLPSYYFSPEFHSQGGNYSGDFQPYARHYWGTTKNIYGRI